MSETQSDEHSSRLALVTGGTRGIGLAVAQALRDQGCTVLVASRSGGFGQPLGATSPAYENLYALEVDASIDESVTQLCERVKDWWGSPAILVNNAASFDPSPAAELSLEDWINHFNIKVAGYQRFIRALVPGMRELGWGRVINVGGIAARIPSETTAGIVNAGVANLTAMVSSAEIRNGITVNTVHPGATKTDRHRLLAASRSKTRETDTATEEAAIRGSLPLGRLVHPEEVASLIAFLASDQARAITGQAISVDGGSSSSVQY